MVKKKRYPVTHENAVEITTGGTLKQRLSAIDSAVSLKANLASPTFTGTPKAPTPSASTNNTQIATTAFVQGLVDSKIASANAMVYKGTLGTGGTITSLPTTHTLGWTYKVITGGRYAGKICEVGDLVICNTTGTSANDSHWDVVQANIDGAVTGPSTSVQDHIPTFANATGKVIKDSGVSITTLLRNSRKVNAGTGLTGGGALSEDVTIIHQLKPTSGIDAGGSGEVVSGVTIDDLGHVVSTTKTTVTTISGNAGTATRLQTARGFVIEAPGVVGQRVLFDGSAAVTLKFNDCACFDLSGASSDNMDLKNAFHEGYWRPLGLVKDFRVNSVINGPNFNPLLSLIGSYKGKVLLYLGDNIFIPVVFSQINSEGVHVGDFLYNRIHYFMAFHLISTDDGGTVEMVAVKNAGNSSEIPTLPSITWAVLSDFCPKGYCYYDQEATIRYEFNGVDWFYEEYITV